MLDLITFHSHCPSLVKVLSGMDHGEKYVFIAGVWAEERQSTFLITLASLVDQRKGKFHWSTGSISGHGPPDQWKL